MGTLQDDPGGYHAAGYRDRAGGKSFNPPRAGERKEGRNSIRLTTKWQSRRSAQVVARWIGSSGSAWVDS
jgi:hypothetical protein